VHPERKLAQDGEAGKRLASARSPAAAVKARPARTTPVALHLSPTNALGGGGRFQ